VHLLPLEHQLQKVMRHMPAAALLVLHCIDSCSATAPAEHCLAFIIKPFFVDYAIVLQSHYHQAIVL
jgi:hypothetical protein